MLLTWVYEDRVLNINCGKNIIVTPVLDFTKGLFPFLVRLTGGRACRNQSSLWSVWAGNRRARSVLPTIPLKGRIYSGVRVKCFLYFILVPGWSCLSTHPQTPPLLWTIVWVKNYLQLRSFFNPIFPIKTLWGKFNTLFRNSFLSIQLR